MAIWMIYLDCDPEDASLYMGHLIAQSLFDGLDGNPLHIWIKIIQIGSESSVLHRRDNSTLCTQGKKKTFIVTLVQNNQTLQC